MSQSLAAAPGSIRASARATLLTALSLLPDAVVSTDAAIMLTLARGHAVAAGIAIPPVGPRLPRDRTARRAARPCDERQVGGTVTAKDGFVVEPIGYVASPIVDRESAPRQPDEGAPGATLVLDPRLRPAIAGLRAGDEILVLTWLHQARRDELMTHPRDDLGRPLVGVFSTRSPDRPNPIGLHRTTIVAIEGTNIEVDRLEALDGTPVLDIKPPLEALGRR